MNHSVALQMAYFTILSGLISRQTAFIWLLASILHH